MQVAAGELRVGSKVPARTRLDCPAEAFHIRPAGPCQNRIIAEVVGHRLLEGEDLAGALRVANGVLLLRQAAKDAASARLAYEGSALLSAQRLDVAGAGGCQAVI